jgi:NTE family protein
LGVVVAINVKKIARRVALLLVIVLGLVIVRALLPPRAILVHPSTQPRPVIGSLTEPPPSVEPDSVAVCLSGGGYRAALFELGVLWRLNELGALRHVAIVSSVSGGSITAAHLVLHWPELAFDARGVATNFEPLIAEPILELTQRTVDVPAIAKSAFTRTSPAEYVARAYDQYLFRGATLESLALPPKAPLLSLNTTRLESGALWSFGQTGIFTADWPVGSANLPDDRRLPLAVAVAASSAFPPWLAPLSLDLHELYPPIDPKQMPPSRLPYAIDPDALRITNQQAPYEYALSSHIQLVDGGVRNNLGTESCTAKGLTIVVDAAIPTHVTAAGSSWPQVALRVVDLMYSAKEDIARGAVMNRDALAQLPEHKSFVLPVVGVSLGGSVDIAGYPSIVQTLSQMLASTAFSAEDRAAVIARTAAQSPDIQRMTSRSIKTLLLAAIPTRLKGLRAEDQNHLINTGYLACEQTLLSTLVTWNKLPASLAKPPWPVTSPPFLPLLLSAPAKLPRPVHPCLYASKVCGRTSFEGL